MLRHFGVGARQPLGLDQRRAFMLDSPPLADVTEHHDCARHVSLSGLDRRGAVVHGNFTAVFRDQHGVIREAHNHVLAQHLADRILRRPARVLVDDDEHVLEPLPDRLRRGPPSQRLRDRIQPCEAS